MSDSGLMFRDAPADWNCILGLQWQNTARLFLLHTPYSYQMTVSRQIYFHKATLSVPSFLFVFSPKKWFSFLSSFSPDQTCGPNLLFHSEPSLHSSFFYLHLIEVSGGSREVTGVCLLGPSVCLSNEPETQGVSLLWRWGDRGRPKGDKPR